MRQLTLDAWELAAVTEEVEGGSARARIPAAGAEEDEDGAVDLRRPSSIPSPQRKKETSRSSWCSSICSASFLATSIRGGDLD